MTALTILPLKLFNNTHKRVMLVMSVFLFPLMFTSIIFSLVVFFGKVDLQVISHKSDYAQIDSPKHRSIVNKNFTISGSLKTPLIQHSYYLVELRNKYYWPKYDLGNIAKSWKKPLTHRAKTNKFSSYQVIMADTKIKDKFDTWFKNSQATGKYPGLSINLAKKNIVANIKVKSK